MKAKISIIALGVSDFARSVAFYRDGLGFPVSGKPGADHVMFDLEGTKLFLYPRDKLAEECHVPPQGTGFPGFTLAHNVKSEAEADAVFDHAVSVGARAVQRPHKVFWGGYSGYFADPDGYYWEVAYNPHTDLT